MNRFLKKQYFALDLRITKQKYISGYLHIETECFHTTAKTIEKACLLSKV